MSQRICPVCEMEMTRDHNCSDYKFSSFSIELELLDLSFNLEPYGSSEDHHSPLYVAENNSIEYNMPNKPVPLFLRL